MSEIRDCVDVIRQIIDEVPVIEVEFISDLNWVLDDATYKAPEETIQWVRTHEVLVKHINNPTKQWQYKVLSIFSTKSIEAIKNYYQGDNKKEEIA